MPMRILTDKAEVEAALERCRWIIADAARELGVSRQGVYDAMRRFSIPRRYDLEADRERDSANARKSHGARRQRVPA